MSRTKSSKPCPGQDCRGPAPAAEDCQERSALDTVSAYLWLTYNVGTLSDNLRTTTAVFWKYRQLIR